MLEALPRRALVRGIGKPGVDHIRRGLMAFRAVYYAFSLVHLPRSIRALRQRAFNIRDDSEMRVKGG